MISYKKQLFLGFLICLASCSSKSPRTYESTQANRASSNTAQSQSSAVTERLISIPMKSYGTGNCITTLHRVIQRDDYLFLELSKPNACTFLSIDLSLNSRSFRLDGTNGNIQWDQKGHYRWTGDKGFLRFRVAAIITPNDIASLNLTEIGCTTLGHCLTGVTQPASSAPSTVRTQPNGQPTNRLSCTELARASCRPDEAKNAASIMCQAVTDGCEKVSQRIEKFTDRNLVRTYCASRLDSLADRKDEPGKILYRYRFNETNAAGKVLSDVGNSAIKEGGVIGGVFGMYYKFLGDVIFNSAVNAGKGGNCEGEYQNACVAAYKTWQAQCQ